MFYLDFWYQNSVRLTCNFIFNLEYFCPVFRSINCLFHKNTFRSVSSVSAVAQFEDCCGLTCFLIIWCIFSVKPSGAGAFGRTELQILFQVSVSTQVSLLHNEHWLISVLSFQNFIIYLISLRLFSVSHFYFVYEL